MDTVNSGESLNSNFLLWIIIGCQFLVNVVLTTYILLYRFSCSNLQLVHLQQLVKVVDNVPPTYQEFATPIEEAAALPLTPRAAFQYPPPPAEAVYEINTNCGEETTMRRAKVAVYEDHRFNKNDPRSHQHNIYAKVLD